jgi:organic radical activating enzyme
MAAIHIDGRDVLLEITEQCRTGCQADYCYKKLTVSSSGAHVPLNVIESRLHWIRTHTDAVTVTLLGGEAWLHPQYVEICKLVLQNGFRLDLITSAVIGRKERDNHEYSLQLFEAGLLDISLSYHAGRNHRQFVSLVRDLQQRVEKRRLAGTRYIEHLVND